MTAQLGNAAVSQLVDAAGVLFASFPISPFIHADSSLVQLNAGFVPKSAPAGVKATMESDDDRRD
ncbi:MAG: hypothetical protein AAFR99_19610, partial [Cyanobacteria bacterium J06629_9]